MFLLRRDTAAVPDASEPRPRFCPAISSGLEPDQTERLVQNPGTRLAHLPAGRLPGWSGRYFEQSGGVDACGEAEKSLRQLAGGLHGGVVADAVE